LPPWMPKTYLSGFKRSLASHVGEGLREVCQVLYLLARHNDVVDVGENVSANLVLKYRLSEAGECRPNILEALGHSHEAVGAEGCDEAGIRFVLFAEIYLMITGKIVKQGHELAACCRIDDFVDTREGDFIFRACFV
jgi:hypothetical protein